MAGMTMVSSDTFRPATGFLPRGGTLDPATWQRRHDAILILLWLHAAALIPIGLLTGNPLGHSALEAAAVAALAAMATYPRSPRVFRAATASIGLLAASGLLVHFFDGYIEVHFHFFVMLAVITLYQHWVPLLLSIAFVVLHHGTLGLLDPRSVYNHPAAWGNPWGWAAIHGGFILAACAASVAHWRFTEGAQVTAREADQRAYADLAAAEARVRASEARFRSLIERSADGISLVDATGAFIYVSPAVQRISGFTPDETVGRNVLNGIHDEDRDRVAARFAALVSGAPGAPRTATESFRRRKKDGTWGWIEATATNLLHDPTVGAIVVNYRDATTRKEAEASVMEMNGRLRLALAEISEREAVNREHAERLRLLNGFARSVSGTLDLDSVFAIVTRQVPTLVGAVRCSVARREPGTGGSRLLAVYPREQEEPGAVADMGPGALVAQVATSAGAIEAGGAWVVSDTREESEPLLRRLASSGILSTAVVPLSTGSGMWGTLNVGFPEPGLPTPDRVEILEAVAAHLGVVIKNAQLYTDVSAAHEELRRTQAQVVQHERLRALGQMASGIAHDFNNALAPVVGFSELLLNHPEELKNPANAADYLGLIHTGARDAARVVGRLREFYRPRDDDALLPGVSLPDLAAQVIALTQPKWKDEAQRDGKTVSVVADLPPVPTVAGNDAELREALTNLIFNAVDALPPGAAGGTITVRTLPTPRGAAVEVQDTGVGMDDETRRRCLDPFFTSKGERGTGLGLAMVWGTVQRHGGTLDIESAPGAGTTIRIGLPAAREPSDVAVDPTPMRPSAAQTDSPLRVLVVDDEPAARRVAVAMLGAAGHVVESVASGREALELLRHGCFDVVLTDRAMPDMRGDQLAAASKAIDPRLPVVLMTGFGELMNAAGECPPGVDLVLGKPITRDPLVRALVAVTRRQPVRATLPDPAHSPN